MAMSLRPSLAEAGLPLGISGEADIMSGPHLHLILNHGPVVGSVFALLLLAWAVFRRNDVLKRAGLAATVLVALATIPTYLTGRPAWEGIMDVPGDNDAFVLAHQSAAQFAFGVS